MKKIIVVLFLIVTMWIILRFPRNYIIKYKVGKYTVKEEYNRRVQGYLFTINNKYDAGVSNKYIGKHVIKSIKIDKKNKDCLNIESDKIELIPLCKNDGEQVVSSIYNKTKNKTSKEYKNIEIFNLNDKTVAIWNHLGYYLLSDDGNKNIKFLKEEQYYNNGAFLSNKFLITPNYDEEYEFSNFKVINLKNKKMFISKLEKKLNYNYYYLGTYKKRAYLIDKKNYKEYALNIKNGEVKDITDNNYGKLLDEKWKDVSIKKLVNNEYKFETSKLYNYYLKDDTLYLKYYKKENNIKVSNLIIKQIIAYNNDEVIYISDDTLYSYSPASGEIKMLTFSELSFNSYNQVFVY